MIIVYGKIYHFLFFLYCFICYVILLLWHFKIVETEAIIVMNKNIYSLDYSNLDEKHTALS